MKSFETFWYSLIEGSANSSIPDYEDVIVRERFGQQEVKAVNISFVVDVTGSMGDELEYIKKEIKWLPFKKAIYKDHELQVFLALFFCFAGALVASLFGLSEALGAFVGGLVMHAGKATEWITDAIHSFRILFVAIFFISIGAQIDLLFLKDNAMEIGILLMAVFLVNHFINAVILRMSGNPWSTALVGGALLAQIGELSFVLAASSYGSDIISDFTYQLSISIISLTLLLSPFWVLCSRQLFRTEQ